MPYFENCRATCPAILAGAELICSLEARIGQLQRGEDILGVSVRFANPALQNWQEKTQAEQIETTDGEIVKVLKCTNQRMENCEDGPAHKRKFGIGVEVVTCRSTVQDDGLASRSNNVFIHSVKIRANAP